MDFRGRVRIVGNHYMDQILVLRIVQPSRLRLLNYWNHLHQVILRKRLSSSSLFIWMQARLWLRRTIHSVCDSIVVIVNTLNSFHRFSSTSRCEIYWQCPFPSPSCWFLNWVNSIWATVNEHWKQCRWDCPYANITPHGVAFLKRLDWLLLPPIPQWLVGSQFSMFVSIHWR